MSEERKYFQDYMPGNICFGCGRDNHDGLQISSYWSGDIAVCEWTSEPKYQGWRNIMNGGIIASLIDCHCMGTAVAGAYKDEGRALGSSPEYRYATGTMNIKYLKPTPNDQEVRLEARILEADGRKTKLVCHVKSGEVITAEAEVIAIRVFDSSRAQKGTFNS